MISKWLYSNKVGFFLKYRHVHGRSAGSILVCLHAGTQAYKATLIRDNVGLVKEEKRLWWITHRLFILLCGTGTSPWSEQVHWPARTSAGKDSRNLWKAMANNMACHTQGPETEILLCWWSLLSLGVPKGTVHKKEIGVETQGSF